MLTYTPTRTPTYRQTREYPWALLLLVFIWLWPGVFSHDLWKPNEPIAYTIIQEATLGAPWQPTLHGSAHFEISPLYIQAALIFQKLLSPWAADAYSAARFASVLFTTIGLLGSGMAGYRFLGRHHGRSVVLILIGSAGLLPIGHFIGAQSVLFAGSGLTMWGYSIIHRQVAFSAVLIGIGATFLAQSAGLLMAAAVLFSGCLMYAHTQWRNNRTLIALIGATVIAAPLSAVYPLALSATSTSAFELYIQHHIFGSFGGTRSFQAAFQLPYYAKHILWFAFPALPLAAWTISRGKLTQQTFGIFALTWLGVFGTLLAINPQSDQDLLVLILPPLALLGAAQLDNLRRGAAAFLNWFGIMTFGFAALFLWLGFVAMNYGFPAKLAERAAYFSPYYTRDINLMPLIVALVFTPMWFIAITRKRIRGRQAVTNWAAGMTLVWALLMTLFLPWIDAAKSYRPVVQNMQNTLPKNIKGSLKNGTACLFIHPNSDNAIISWQQYGDLPFTTRQNDCRYELVAFNPKRQAAPTTGKILWEGRRPRHKKERFALVDKGA
ncbi:ArnT family glycosyltransferase [Wielerella bovis]|uniref:ArnT family glycosyltransferase n=1 Tax=Wielerella bovis TaxID=2917790 RepID=UPI0020192EEF|nr:glycosyltransferase family 39 protein [Wielerella bovis]ULJ64308.1 glycosyltransferase family 39 protein [Wielerella bovis]ULJ66527.1 glycosyltransferase family 39 protein [Wielerella bovis]